MGERTIQPFPGLRPFRTDEQFLFFGREGHAQQIVSCLRQNRFVSLIGPSGSGKSSLINAGLLPFLHGGIMAGAGSNWRIARFRPGSDPIGHLACSLTLSDGIDAGSGEADRQRDTMLTEVTLRRSGLGLIEAVRLARRPHGENLLVIVDQFEELFRYERLAVTPRQHEEAAAFVKLLLEATAQHSVPIYVVVAMRSDFLGDCSKFPCLPEAVTKAPYIVPWLTRDQQRSAVVNPLLVAAATITPRLVNRVLSDAGDSPDRLPILQHALMRTWESWKNDIESRPALDLDHYEAVGGIENALSRHANEAYDELPTDKARLIVKRMFQALSERGPDKRGVRRPASLETLAAIAECTPDELKQCAEPFSRSGREFILYLEDGSLRPDDHSPILDISHESLIVGWDKLREWVDEEAESARIYLRLSDRAEEHRRGFAALMPNPDLEKTLEWRESNAPTLEWSLRYNSSFLLAMAFLDESRLSVERKLEAEARKKQEEEDLKAEDLRTARRQLRFVACLCALSVIFGIAAVYLWYQSAQSAKRARASEEKASYNEERTLGFAKDTLNALNKVDVGSAAESAADKVDAKGEANEDQQGDQSYRQFYTTVFRSAKALAADILTRDPDNREAEQLSAASSSYLDHLQLEQNEGSDSRLAEAACSSISSDGQFKNSDVHHSVPKLLRLASCADISHRVNAVPRSKEVARRASGLLSGLICGNQLRDLDAAEWHFLHTTIVALDGVLADKPEWENASGMFDSMTDHSMGGNAADKSTGRRREQAASSLMGDSGPSTSVQNSGEPDKQTEIQVDIVDHLTNISKSVQDDSSLSHSLLSAGDAIAESLTASSSPILVRNRMDLRLAQGYVSLAHHTLGVERENMLDSAEHAYVRMQVDLNKVNPNDPITQALLLVFHMYHSDLERERGSMHTASSEKSRDWEKALTDDDAAIHIWKEHSTEIGPLLTPIVIPLLHSQRGEDLLLMHRDADAEKEFELAVSLVPKVSPTAPFSERMLNEDRTFRIYEEIRRSFDHLGMYADARVWVDKATKRFSASSTLSPGRTERVAMLYGDRSWLDLLVGEFGQAVKDAKSGYSLDPKQVWILTNMAHAYLFEGDLKDAQNIYLSNLNRHTNTGEDKTFRDAVLDDFEDFRKHRYPKMDLSYLPRVEELIRRTESASRQ